MHEAGEMYERGLEVLRYRGSTTARDRIRSIVIVEVTAAAPIVSPAFDDGTSEATITERWLQHYRELWDPARKKSAG